MSGSPSSRICTPTVGHTGIPLPPRLIIDGNLVCQSLREQCFKRPGKKTVCLDADCEIHGFYLPGEIEQRIFLQGRFTSGKNDAADIGGRRSDQPEDLTGIPVIFANLDRLVLAV